MIRRPRHKRARTTIPGMLRKPEAYSAHQTQEWTGADYNSQHALQSCGLQLRRSS